MFRTYILNFVQLNGRSYSKVRTINNIKLAGVRNISYLVLSVRLTSRSPITASNSACTLACTSWCLRSIKMTNDNMLLVVSEPAKNKSNNRTRSCSSVNEFGSPLLFSISVKNAQIKSSWSLCLCSSIDSYINIRETCIKHVHETTTRITLTFKNV